MSKYIEYATLDKNMKKEYISFDCANILLGMINEGSMCNIIHSKAIFFGLSQFNLSPVTALAIPTIFVTADKHSLVGHYGVGVNSPGGDYGGWAIQGTTHAGATLIPD